MSFVDLPLELNAEALVEAVYSDMADVFPGWEPAPGNPETFLIRAIVMRLIAPLAQLAVDAGEEIFAQFGAQVAGVAPIAAAQASVQSTWTMVDNQGYTIPDGTQVDVPISGDTSVGFQTLGEVLVPAGSTVTDIGEVTLVAVEAGSAGNGLSGTGRLVDALSYVSSVALVGTSSGGTDAEDPLVYLGRLADTMQTFGPHPILPRDVEILARGIAGVARATTLDLFNPATDDPNDPSTWDSERHCSVAVVDEDGQPCSAPTKTAVGNALEARRETNFVFHVLDPTYSTIKVNFQVTPQAGFDQTTIEGAVISNLSAFLSPANWGLGSESDRTQWVNRRVVRYQDLVTVVNDTQGVDFYTALKSGKGAGALGTADLTLDGAAALPQPGVIQVGS